MAGSALVGALRVTLGLDSAQFQAGLRSSQTGLQRFGSIAKTGALAIGAAMVAAGGVVAMAVKGMIDEADKMSKLSQSIGVPISDLSRLGYAADLAGVDIDTLGKGIKRLSANMLDATETTTGLAARGFSALGISVTDASGKMKSAKDMITELADKFKAMPDGVNKTALAMRLFGKSGADLIPLLNGGSDGLVAMYQEAEQLGIVLDEQTGKAAEAFNDNLTRMGKIKDGIITKITAGMLPALLSLSDAMVGAAKDSDAMRIIGAALGWTLNGLVTVAVLVGAAFVGVASDIGAAWDAANRFVRLDFSGGVVAFQAGISRTQTLLKSAETFVGALWRPPSGPPPVVPALDATGDAAGRAAHAVNRVTDAQREAQRAAADWAREQERLADALRRDGEQIFESTRTAAERYTSEIGDLVRLLAAGEVSVDTFRRKMAQLRAEFEANDPAKQAEAALRQKISDYQNQSQQDAIAIAADNASAMRESTYSGISDGLRAAADGNLGQYLASRIRESLFDGLANSLTDLLSGSGKKGGGGIFSAIANIFSGGIPGFAGGGSIMPGGSGGIDSQIVAFRKSPNERVDITRPGQDRGGAMAVHVIPSPYFDVRVEQVAAPLAVQSGVAAAGHSARTIPADMAQRQRYQRS